MSTVRQRTEVQERIARRQIQVGNLAAQGLTRYQIAAHLDVALATVRNDLDAMDMPNVPIGKPVRKRPVQRDICGTATGYEMHQRRRENACDPCKAANTRRAAERRGP